MIVGEAPGRTEIENFIPFSGQAGKELMASLALVGLTREEVYITSAVRSRPYSIKERINKRSGAHEVVHPNRTPTKRSLVACAFIGLRNPKGGSAFDCYGWKHRVTKIIRQSLFHYKCSWAANQKCDPTVEC